MIQRILNTCMRSLTRLALGQKEPAKRWRGRVVQDEYRSAGRTLRRLSWVLAAALLTAFILWLYLK